ncbi:hypothetical protein [Lewinella sp. JB7]|uniref:hypothetical protein n=1 Tax=Lewinella sp. JB7 TaxID=2962887 RepID=UPI0020C9BF24|nr:hypothetical protein [Lewinella sp. JB7]MCP9236276.1 hypothetical protein [Lewinella sp. JB7]
MRKHTAEGTNLDLLQINSWQLELLVTGFALAGMLSGFDAFGEWTKKWLDALSGKDLVSSFVGGLIVCLSFAYIITLANLFVHVVLRCLWIGAIGSRSVMGDTVLIRRRLAPKFRSFLQRRTGNFDRYIQHVDDAASLIFAFTFLLIVVAVSIFTITGSLAGLVLLINTVSDGGTFWTVLLGIILFAYLFFVLVYFVDFLTAGYLKRFRFFSHLYFPFYRLLGWITLARLYRPLYYNLLSRKHSYWFALVLVPYLFLAVTLLSLQATPFRYVSNDYFDNDTNGKHLLRAGYYADENDDRVTEAMVELPSQIIRASPLRVRIPLYSSYEAVIARQCPELLPPHQSVIHSVILSRLFGSEPDAANSATLTPHILECLGSSLSLYLDSNRLSLHDVFLTRQDHSLRPDLIKFIPLDTLTPGLHYLNVHQRQLPSPRRPEDSIRAIISVPFYYASG